MNICVVGSGYVGLVTGACFADLGNNVICVDSDRDKIKKLKAGMSPIYEPGLEEMIVRNMKEGRLSFSVGLRTPVEKSNVIFIAVGTPPKENGEADLSGVEMVCSEIAKIMRGYRLIVEKSTVPVQTGEWVERTVKLNARKGVDFDVASNPEFLREGSAINDFMHPDRIILGVKSKRAESILRQLYAPMGSPIIVTDIKSAELIKHASNSFLAMKISFINAISNICESVGADVEKVAEGMGYDRRIGRDFLNAGIGFGGFCFPKDLEAFIHISEKLGYNFNILKEVRTINEQQRDIFVEKIEKCLWILSNKTIGVLGISFKPDTDDIRFAPSIDIIKKLQQLGARIKAYDPKAMEKAKAVLKNVRFCKDAYDVAKGCDALVILTQWNEFRELDLLRIRRILSKPVIIDGRNIYDPAVMRKLDFTYVCVGRP
jgi:UDPglucose 6-dehydrogenase